MADFVKVAQRREVPDGTMKQVTVGSEEIALANVGGEFFAFCNACTHDNGPLAEGDLEGDVVTCPWHFSTFNVRTGEVIDSPAHEPVATFQVRVEGDDILVSVP